MPTYSLLDPFQSGSKREYVGIKCLLCSMKFAYIYIYIYIYIHTHTQAHSHTHTHIYIYIHTHTHTKKKEQCGSIHFIDESKFTPFVCGGRRFVPVLYNDICLSSLKETLNLEEELVMAFCIILTAATGPVVRLHSKINTTVYKETVMKHT